MRPQGREVEREGRKVVMTTAWRNKSYHRMKFSKPVIQGTRMNKPVIQLFRRSPRTRNTDEQAITFTDEDAERVHHPHDDAIVITLLLANYTTRRVSVDNGSLVDIFYYPTFQQMRLGRDLLRLVNSPLVGFGGMKVQPVGTVTLPVIVGAYPQ